jgi:hypothetical protein
MAPLNNQWLVKWVDKNPKTVKYALIKTGEKVDDVRVVLTGETPELQRLIRMQLKNDEAWGEAFELTKD